MISEAELLQIIGLCESKRNHAARRRNVSRHGVWGPLKVAASLSDSVISVSSLSKTWGLPESASVGLSVVTKRWRRCSRPKNRYSSQTRLSTKKLRCVSFCASRVFLPRNLRHHEAELFCFVGLDGKPRRGVGRTARRSGLFSAFCRFPSRRRRPFYQILNEQYQTYVGPGHWFEMPRRYMRIGYGWPKTADLAHGLSAISAAAKLPASNPALGGTRQDDDEGRAAARPVARFDENRRGFRRCAG